MYFMIFDTETTGLSPKDEVIQFAGLLVRTTTREEKEAMKAAGKPVKELKMSKFYNFYCDTIKSINPDAAKIHGIDKKKLKELSQGYTFEDNFLPIIKELEEFNICWIAYNVAFDKRIINQTLSNNGLPIFDFGKTKVTISDDNTTSNFCLMNAMTSLNTAGKRRKLAEVVDELGYTKEAIDKSFAIFAKQCGLDPKGSYHDATYDVFCTYLVFEKYFNKLRG